jgi:hypothetical protein
MYFPPEQYVFKFGRMSFEPGLVYCQSSFLHISWIDTGKALGLDKYRVELSIDSLHKDDIRS